MIDCGARILPGNNKNKQGKKVVTTPGGGRPPHSLITDHLLRPDEAASKVPALSGTKRTKIRTNLMHQACLLEDGRGRGS